MSFSKSRVERFPTCSKSSDGTGVNAGSTYKRAVLSSSMIAATPPNVTDGRKLKEAQARSTGSKLKATTKERIPQVQKSHHSGNKSGASFSKPPSSPSFRVGRTPTSVIHRKCIIKRTPVKANNKRSPVVKCKPGNKSNPSDDVTLPSDSEIFQTPQASEPSDWEDARGSELEMDDPPGIEIQSSVLPMVGESQRATAVVIASPTSDLSEIEIINVDNRSEIEENFDAVPNVIISEITSSPDVMFSEQPTIPVLPVGVNDVSDETNATIITIGRKPRRFSTNKNQEVFSLFSSLGVPVPLHAFSFYSTGQFGSIQTMQQSHSTDLNTSRILTSHADSNRNFTSVPLLQHSLQEDSPQGTLFCPLSSSTMWSSNESSPMQGTNTLNAAVISGGSSESESEYIFGRQPNSSNYKPLTLQCYQWIVQNFQQRNPKSDKKNRSFSSHPSETSGLNQILADDNDEQRISRFTPIRHRLANSADNGEERHRATGRPSFGRSTKRVCRRVWRILRRDSPIVIGYIKNNLLVPTKILLRDYQVWTLVLEFIAGQVLELVLSGISVKIRALKE